VAIRFLFRLSFIFSVYLYCSSIYSYCSSRDIFSTAVKQLCETMKCQILSRAFYGCKSRYFDLIRFSFMKGLIGYKELVQVSGSCGVPQGSMVGPIRFLLYIIDIWTSSNIFILFADDTNIFLYRLRFV